MPTLERVRKNSMIFYKRIQPVKAITFDLDDTFYDNHPFIKKAQRRMFEFMCQGWPEVEQLGWTGWQHIRREIIRKSPMLKNDMIVLRKEVLTQVFSSIGLIGAALDNAIQDSYDQFFDERSNFKVAASYLELLAELSAKVPLIAITNGNVDLERIGIAPYFSNTYHASIEQPMKPHSCMFQKAREHLDLPSENILHVGDCLKNDIFGAARLGFQTAWYAENREMKINRERTAFLPNVQLHSLHELKQLLPE